MSIPNLAGVATANLVESIGTGKFSAAYINWSRTMNLLREHAPGWLPEIVQDASGSVIHAAPHGAYMLIRFVNLTDGTHTPAVPQAVMDHRNAAIPLEKITARDITDTHRRGVCLAAAMQFGLAYELWAKLPLESGYAQEAQDDAPDKDHDAYSEFSRMIAEAADMIELEKVGKQLAGASLSANLTKGLRAAYSVRVRELKESGNG